MTILILPNPIGAQALDSLKNYDPDLFSAAIRMITVLAIILGGMLIIFYFMRRIFKREVGRSKEKLIKVIASTYIGVKKTISLVEVPGVILVLGISGDHITLLTKIENKEILDRSKTFDGQHLSSSFSSQLDEFSSQFKKDKLEDFLSQVIHSIREKVDELKKI
jgi:flagellar biosynthetic protein FliO